MHYYARNWGSIATRNSANYLSVLTANLAQAQRAQQHAPMSMYDYDMCQKTANRV